MLEIPFILFLVTFSLMVDVESHVFQLQAARKPIAAREYLTKGLEIFERLGTLIEPDNVRKELAELAH